MKRIAARPGTLLLAAALTLGGALGPAATGFAAESRATDRAAADTLATIGPTGARVALAAGTASIQGTGLVGQPLSIVTAGWMPAGVAFAYQWSVGGRVVAGATSSTYTPVAADVGKRVTATVTGSFPGQAPVKRTASLAASVSEVGSIAGTVYRAGSPARPVVNGYVTLYASYAIAGEYTEPLAFTGIVNGRYLLPDVAPGAYTLQFRDAATDQAAFLGGGTIGSASTAFTVSSGRQATKNFTFTDVGSITGVLSFDGPAPAPGDYFAVEALSSTGAGSADVAPDGSFTITGLPGGSYTLSVQAYNAQDHTPIYRTGSYTTGRNATPARVSVAAGRTAPPVSFVLKPAPVISGVVTDARTGLGVPFVLIEAYRVSGGSVGFIESNQTDAQGHFSLAGVEPGQLKLSAVPPLGEGLEPAYFGGTSLAGAKVYTVKNGDTVAGLTVTLPASPAAR